ncbi:MAG: U32 family peptidase [Planctomycetota bacterium]
MDRIELLAPARTADIGIAAIDCGADAVYIGAPRFGARADAGNTLADITRLIAHAHTFRARIYATLNTLLTDAELKEAATLAWELHQAGIDGLIIQDPGLLKAGLPPLPLIASTQMHNATPAKIQLLEQAGFNRAIIARELSLDEIRAIRRATRLELECFVHGAVCVGMSGRCRMSYAIGGRSGNRGQCAQPCRRPYDLVTEAGRTVVSKKHLLCLKDMRRVGQIGALLDAGVTAFKIEGRLKDQAYVMNSTAYYRSAIDKALKERDLKRASSGTSRIDFAPDPAKSFNRGFTPYFIQGRERNMASLDTPKSRGEFLGRVAARGNAYFRLAGGPAVHNGDGLCFVDNRGNLRGTQVNRVEDGHILPDTMEGIMIGQEIYRNRDNEFQRKLDKSRTRRAIAIRMTLTPVRGGLVLDVEDEDGVRGRAETACATEPARDPATAVAELRRHLGKTGTTPFELTDMVVAGEPAPAVPPSVLNALRREALDALLAARTAGRPVWEPAAPVTPALPGADPGAVHLNRGAQAFYTERSIPSEPAPEAGLPMLGRAVMSCKYCIRYEMGMCLRDDKDADTAPLRLVDENGLILPLHFNCTPCEMEVRFGQNGPV